MFLLLGAAGGLASLGLWLAGRIRGGRDGRRAGRTARAGRSRRSAAAVAAQRDAQVAVPPRRHADRRRRDRRRGRRRGRRVGPPSRSPRRVRGDARLGAGDVEPRPRSGERVSRRRAPRRGRGDGRSRRALRRRPGRDRSRSRRRAGRHRVGGPGRRPVADRAARHVGRAGRLAADRRRRRTGGLGLVPVAPAHRGGGRHHDGRRGRRRRAASPPCSGGSTRATDRHVLVATDRPDLLALRTGALRRFLGAAASTAVLVEVPPDEVVPAFCRSALEIGSIGLARWRPETSSPPRPGRVHVAGVTAATAARVARRLAALHDPEDPAAAELALATAVTLSSLRERHGSGPIDDAIAVAGSWRSAGRDPAPAAAIGVTADGVVEIDLARDGPHALIAGTTGSGKSELLRTLVVSLAARSSPDHLTFVLVDYKGGATFDACAELPHTVGVVTDLDERLAERALLSLDAELRRRERLLARRRRRGPRRLPGDPRPPSAAPAGGGHRRVRRPRRGAPRVPLVARRRGPARPQPRHPPRPRHPTAVRRRRRRHPRQHQPPPRPPAAAPRRCPRRGRRPGTGGVPASDTGPSDAAARPGRDGRVPGGTEQRSGATPPRRPAAGDRRLRTRRTPATSASSTSSFGRSGTRRRCRTSRRPTGRGCRELPARIDPAGGDGLALGPGDVGIVDDPAEQCRRPLHWRPDDGHLALLGGRGAGTTTALRTVVAAMARERPPARLHVYVIDAGGDRPPGRPRPAAALRRRRAPARAGAPRPPAAPAGGRARHAPPHRRRRRPAARPARHRRGAGATRRARRPDRRGAARSS